MEGADIYQIAKNCRTSVEMIETFYASHIKNTLDAAAVNLRKPKLAKKNDMTAPWLINQFIVTCQPAMLVPKNRGSDDNWPEEITKRICQVIGRCLCSARLP
jgi:hypothetical protein